MARDFRLLESMIFTMAFYVELRASKKLSFPLMKLGHLLHMLAIFLLIALTVLSILGNVAK